MRFQKRRTGGRNDNEQNECNEKERETSIYLSTHAKEKRSCDTIMVFGFLVADFWLGSRRTPRKPQPWKILDQIFANCCRHPMKLHYCKIHRIQSTFLRLCLRHQQNSLSDEAELTTASRFLRGKGCAAYRDNRANSSTLKLRSDIFRQPFEFQLNPAAN